MQQFFTNKIEIYPFPFDFGIQGLSDSSLGLKGFAGTIPSSQSEGSFELSQCRSGRDELGIGGCSPGGLAVEG